MNYYRSMTTANSIVSRDEPLTLDQIRRVAPSVFAEGKHESRSDRFTFIPTSDVLAGLQREGFNVFMAAQSRSRIPGKAAFTRHLLRLRQSESRVPVLNGEAVPEIILLNAHDGTSSYQLISGMFRFVCLNGMVCGENVESVRVPHKGDIIGRVIEGAFEVVDNFDRAREFAEQARAIELTQPEQRLLAHSALQLRYDDVEDGKAFPITEEQALTPRRSEDRKNDLWTTFNRLQENLTQGGLRGRSASGRRQRTRAVTGVQQNVGLNRALWTLAEGMAQLKG